MRNKFIRKGFAAVFKVMKPIIKSLIPVVTGLLRKSISSLSKVRGDKAILVVGASRKVEGQFQRGRKVLRRFPANYSRFINTGKTGYPGTGFLKKMEFNYNTWYKILSNNLRDNINKALR